MGDLWPKVKDWNWETIFYRHYRFVFNHCDANLEQSNRIRWKKRKIKVKRVKTYSSLQAGLRWPLRELTCHMGSHSVYLPTGRGDIPALGSETREALCGSVVRPSAWPRCPSVNTYFAWRDILVLSGRILMKLSRIFATCVGTADKVFNIRGRSLNALFRPRDTHRLTAVRPLSVRRRHSDRQRDVEADVL